MLAPLRTRGQTGAMVRSVLVLAALGLPLLLVHCAAPVIVGTTDESSLVGDDAMDAGDAGDARSDAADDAADAAAKDAGASTDDADAAPPPMKKPTTPVTPGDAGDDARTTGLSSTYPDPSTVRLGPLPDGSGGCESAPGTTGTLAAPLLAMICLAALRRRRE